MISWIQLTFQRHFRVIFLVLLAVLIVSFVFTIGAAPGIGSGEQRTQTRMFFDLNLSSAEGQATLYQDAALSVLLQAGMTNIPDAQMQEFALQRYASLYLANQLNLPGPNDEQLKEFIQSVRTFMGPEGKFDPTAYATFREDPKSGGRYTEADIKRVLEDDYRARRVNTLLAGPGYVEDGEIAFQLARTDTTWSVDIAKVDYNTFAPTIEPSDEALRAYFDNNAFRYEIPPMVRVSYVEFPATSFLVKVNLTDDEIRSYYESNPARFPKPTTPEGNEAPAIGADTLESDFLAVRDQVSAALRYERARRLAASAAADLTVAIYDSKASGAALAAFVAEQGQALRAAAPFSQNNPPSFLGGSRQAAAAAFRLDRARPVSDALPTASGAVVLVYEESIPSAPSEFESVVDRVRTDFVANEKRQRFVELGRSIRTSLKNQIAAGASFADAVTKLENTQGATVTAVSFADFTARDRPQDFPYAAASSLESLNAGDFSQMVISGNEGLITHAAAKTLPATDASNPRYDELRGQLASYNGATTATGAIRALVARELGLNEVVTREVDE